MTAQTIWQAWRVEAQRIWQAWVGVPSLPPDAAVDVQDASRRQAIREAEFDQSVAAVSKIQRVSGQPVRRGGLALREGRLTKFVLRPDAAVLGYRTYSVRSVHGEFEIGQIRWRSQWGSYAYYPHAEAVLNTEILAEVYAMLRELRS